MIVPNKSDKFGWYLGIFTIIYEIESSNRDIAEGSRTGFFLDP